MPQGKLRGGGLRGDVQSTVRESYGGKAMSSNFKSRVVHPRNPKLVKGRPEDDKQAPSAYMAEMQLTTDERLKLTYEMRVPQIIELLDMSEQSLQRFTTMDIEEPIFQPFPSDIVFQNFEPFQTYEVPLQLRNNDKVARLVKVTQTDSPYFKIVSPHDVGHKVAPGMDTIFIIQFTPDETKDYTHELICITEREKFLVPVKAIGARAILDFPDEISFGTCPVKYATTKTLLVRNIGNSEAKFQLAVVEPFFVTPESGRLAVGESTQIDVDFKALQTGDHSSHMILNYETGEDVYISLYGAAIDCNVRLDKNAVKMENTFISCASQRTVAISNRSDIIVQFKWSNFATLREELQQKDRFYMDLESEENAERDDFFEECLNDPTLRDQVSILTRKFRNKSQIVANDKMLYNDSIITIDPVEGEIWPNSQAEINIIFKPQDAQSYARTAYCDVTGRESRLPLRIRGDGAGPKVHFSLGTLDIGNVFINSKHSYEVILCNKGDIDAVFKLIPPSSQFGPQFAFLPAQGIVIPGGYQAIQISFCSPILGDFNEVFYFAVEGSPDELKLGILGSVIGPTFHFNVPKLKFGIVSYGFVNTCYCTLVNTSLIPMTFNLRVPADGWANDEPHSHDSLIDSNISDVGSSGIPFPREFDIVPSSGTIAPQGEMEIKVDFVSTTVKKYDIVLVVDVDGVGDEILSLPIVAKCVVPPITVSTPILDYGRCFLHHPYELPVHLSNDSDLPAKYELLSQVVEDVTPILYSSPEPKGIIQPHSVKEIPLHITAECLEEVTSVAYFMIFGSSDAPLGVQIQCVGEGPVIHVTPSLVDFGTIQVLTDATKIVQLSNESLIPAQFSCNLVRPNSSFAVEPAQGVIPPEDALQLKVTASVDDTVRFQDKLSINITDSQVQTVNLLAFGSGTTIVSEPPLAPAVKLGPQFSCQPLRRSFKLTNRGRRPQQIYWTTEGFLPYRTRKKTEYNPDDMRFQGVPPPSDPPKPIFQLTPDRMVLHPGESQKVKLEGYSEKPQSVKERMFCHSIIGTSTGKERIMKVDVSADFISPLLSFSQREVNFCVMKHPENTLEVETRQVMMTNVSSLPLSVVLLVTHPFQLLVEDAHWAPVSVKSSQSEFSLAVGESIPVLIQFDPSYKDDFVTRTAESQLEVAFKEHPEKDFINLKGEVFFPNLTFEIEKVDFGCILNDTEVMQAVKVTNHSPMDVKYQWSFIDSAIQFENKEEDEGIGVEVYDDGQQEEDEQFLEDANNMVIEVPDHPSPMGSPRELSPRSSQGSRLSTTAEQKAKESSPWAQTEMQVNIGIEEVFDILPLYSTLHPHETQKIQFTFYGHANISSQAIARCSVYGGPDYDIEFLGQASLVQYFFDRQHVDYGKQLFDQVAVAEIVLHNTGKVGLDFVVLNVDSGRRPLPGTPNVSPMQGHVKALSQQTLTIKYLAGVPEKFEKTFQVRVAHFEPDKITIAGEGVFPRVIFDLPLDKEDSRYEEFSQQAIENLGRDKSAVSEKSVDDLPIRALAASVGDVGIRMEVERLLVKRFAVEQWQSARTTSVIQTSSSHRTALKKQRPKAQMISYLLDFGFVVYGSIRSHVIRVTNNGHFPVSFAPDKSVLSGSGFAIELDRVRNLPGEPANESVEFMVTFEPRAAGLPMGVVDIQVPFHVLSGPAFGLRIKAVVTMPDMIVSTDSLDFGTVECGNCKVMTIQLHNTQQVRCEWSSEPPEEKKKKSNKMIPLHLRKKMRSEKAKPKHFEVMPPIGSLMPGQRINVQVKFMPTEEISYSQRLVIRIAQSSSRHVINVMGQGNEPKLEFSSTLIEFGPVLPHSTGDEKELVVRNPSSFPVEIYSLEFDKQYLEEEKMLRVMKGYDEYNTILLPPRYPGEKLPQEVTDAFNEQQRKKEAEEKEKAEAAAAAAQVEESAADQSGENAAPSVISAVPPLVVGEGTKAGSGVGEGAKEDSSSLGVGDLEITPVSAAIARYLGIDLTAEGRAARNRRGIALVVHGAPLSGKTATAVSLAKMYGAALLTVDGVVTEAISSGNTSAAQRAKELCASAARAAKEAEQTVDIQITQPSGGLSVEAVTALSGGTGPSASTAGSVTGAQSFLGKDRKTSTIGGGARGGVFGKNIPQLQQSPPGTPPQGAPLGRKLSVSASVAGEDGLYSCVLPEDLLVEILAERLQLSDCQRGIVFDGLECLFSPSMMATANAILRAFNNRKYIFIVTLMLDQAKLKAVEEKKKEEQAKLDKQKEEEEKRRLEEMSEDEYDALTEEEKAEVDKKHLEQKKERRKRELERQEKEKKERELQALIEEKRLEEERGNQKAKRRGTQQASGVGAKKGHDQKDKKPEKSSDKLSAPSRTTGLGVQAPPVDIRTGAPSVISERSDSTDVAEDKKRLSISKTQKHRQSSAVMYPPQWVPQVDENKPPTEEEEREKELTKRFTTFETSLRDIDNLLQNWDRTTGNVARADTPKSDNLEETIPVPGSTRKGRDKKDKEREQREKEKEKEREKEKSKEVSESPMSVVSGEQEDEENGGKKDGLGVPQLFIDTGNPTESQAEQTLAKGILPSIEEVMDGLGLGPHGPPIPPPATFAVVPYPVRRRPPLGFDPPAHYVFVASAPDDPNAPQEEKAKEPEPEVEKVLEKPQEHGRKGRKDKDDREGGTRSRRERGSSARKSKAAHGAPSPPPSATPAEEEKSDGAVAPSTPLLINHRWEIPANDAVTLRIRFRSEELGQFDQTLNFEIMGTRRRYQLFCRGVCAFPAISREPRVVFPHRRKCRKPEEIVHKKYVLSNETFEFGPLLCGKTRDRYKEGKYPENMEIIVICNTSPLDADISFCFQNDSTAATFILDPPNMKLKPGESQNLTLWAYPKTPGFFEDAVVCCIRENPEPVVFKISSHGVRPELELDRRQLQFDRVLLHRKDTKVIFLRNSTLLPVAWRVNGMDNLGDDFSLTTEHGVIDAKSEFALQMHFRAVRPTNIRKIVRLEISDVEQIMGLVQAENIQVHAESYDVALDMSFPKGADGGLDFGVLKVLDETKQTCSLKNKGKFEIIFNFAFESTDGSPSDMGQLFTVIPNRGPLMPTDRPTQVQVIFRSKNEITIKDEPILKCQIIEPHLGDGGEVIASIPIKISARSVYSKYAVSPVSDINFGAMIVNNKKTRVFAIENQGEFDFRYSVLKMINTVSQGRQRLGPPAKKTKSRDGSSSGRSQQPDKPTKPKRADSVRGAELTTGAPNIRLQLGMFTVYPAVGTVPAGGSVQVTVDMIGENPGYCEESIAIDISDRQPTEHPQGIPYKLIGEACIPGITTITHETVCSIFEEHLIVKQLNLFQFLTHDLASGSGVYGEDENKFIFYNTIVGRKAKARFKISNPNKVPCDLALSVKPQSMKPSARWHDVYEIDPQRASIPAHSFVYATVSFVPPSMQMYNATLEAAVDGMPTAMSKYRNLTFDIQGEGNLPRINVVRPTARNKKGAPVLLFRRLLLGRSQVLQLSLKNEGTLMSRVNIDLKDPEGVYSISCVEGTKTLMPLDEVVDEDDPKSRVHTLTVVVPMGKTADFSIEFNPFLVGRMVGEVRLTVVDNPYEESIIQLIGEGYQDEVTIDNIRSFMQTENQAPDLEIDDNTPASRENHVKFGDCPVGVSKQLSFTLTNHSPSDPVRFTWSPPPEVAFSPCTGHLQPNCAKDVTVTFCSKQPKTHSAVNVPCKITKIKLGEAQDKAVDWDDRMRTVKWVDVTPEEEPSSCARKAPRPAKKKIIEVETEPPFTALENSTKDVELLLSAVCDYAKYRCKVESVHFKDTLMFQSRVYSFTVSNKGEVQLDYQWTFQPVEKPKAVNLAEHFESGPERPASSAGQSRSQRSGRPSTSAGDSSMPAQTRTAPLIPRPSSSMGGRPSSALALAYEAGSVVSEGGSDIFPFVIEPDSGSIPAGKKGSFVIKFSPLDVLEYEAVLTFSAANLQPNTQGFSIPVLGRSLLPYCHFELEESDYVSGGRRNPELKGPGGAPPGSTLDPSTKVIEFKSCGVKVKNVKRFNVINPSNTTYSFSWTNEDSLDGAPESANFRCLTPEGTVLSGKKYEMVFEYVPDSLDLVESFWRFFVPEHNISIPFVMVGHTFEPALSFDRSHINFREVLIGHPVKETVQLLNEENTPFTFSFIQSSCHTEGYSSSLAVEPMSGTVFPKARLPIEISFTATEEKEVNFNVVCHVKKKISPLTLNVKAEGYAMNAQLICEDSLGNKVELTSKGTNRINLGMVEINEKATRQLFVINSGKFNFDFTWEVQNRTKLRGLRCPDGEKLVSVTPDIGTVPCNTRKRCQLAFCPPGRLTLAGCDLLLKITNGPTFTVNLTGTGVQPGLHFSFERHDFGPCFLYRAGMPLKQATLIIRNVDDKDISIESQFENCAHLEVNCQPGVLVPNQSIEVEISFYPREARKYHEIIPFEINGLSTMNVEILGEGTEMKVEVANPLDRKVNFGALRVGQTSQRSLKLVNRSPAPITFTLAITPSVVALQQANILTINPSTEITLRANGGSCGVELTFKPKTRIPHFTEEVMLECAGMSQPIFVVTGSCQGIEISLDGDSVPFGAVVQGSRSSRKLIMHNTGDIGAAFSWNVEKFQPDFSITPVKGYISSGMEVSFEIMFHPTEINHDIRYENLRCAIEGGKPLKLVLTGSCIPQTPLKEVLHFATHVRTRDTRSLVIHNRTNQMWMLRPVIDGEYWSGPDAITVEPQQTKNYELTYRPLTMTQEGKKHTGSVFFALPDGNGLLYNVTGTAEGPKPINNIQREVPCKTSYTEMLTVTNWLRRPQRFRVIIEMLKPEKPDSSTTLKGLDYVDVPGLSKRDYRLNFFAHKEGTFSAKVVFRNEHSGEYLFYYVTFKAISPGVMATIDLSTPIRKSTSHVVTLHNPLSTPVTFNSQCSVADIQLPPSFTVPPLSEGSCMFEYLPLKAGEQTGRLSFTSSELGVYQYDLNLNATPAGTEAPVHFRAGLGTSQSQTCRFVNFAKSKVEYTCKVDNADFHVEKGITAASASSGGTEVGVEVTYEPFRLGDTRATLTVFSAIGGEYVFPLFGHCSPPKPQGPYSIKAGATTSIPFKNVFSHTTQFTFCVDSPCFNVKASESIRGKKTHNVIVGFEGNQGGSKAPRMGRLMVTCPRSAGGAGNVTWTFYLKGVTP
ncbi:hydrocephalus-inducing protein homolog [Montipora foliosa]|uniref:hydrocephalus-inducing protein homolog n=1 Tax=Montipora foliosa TaxID=591990 RepID=UPI0035F1A38A